MNAAFRWEQPDYLVLVLAAACALAAYGWSGRARRSRAHQSNRSATHQLARLTVALIAGSAAALVGTALINLRTPNSTLALTVAAAVSAAWLAARLYRRRNESTAGRAYRLLIALRVLAALTILAIVARPVWEWVEVTWRKPLLAVVLDQSQSMSIRDDQSQRGRSRADLANAALQANRAAIEKLKSLYEIRVYSPGSAAEGDHAWRIEPQTPYSALTTAVHQAAQMCSVDGGRAAAVLLLSDGAENVEAPAALRSAADALAARGTALLGVGVGPAPGAAHSLELDPLFVPARLGSRDRVRVPVTARAQNCPGTKIRLELLWNGERAEARELSVQHDPQRLQAEFDLLPPGPGLQRLTARAVLPASLGGQQVETHAVIDVRDERIRVLHLEDAPHTEAAFLLRALQADPRFELTSRFLFAEAAEHGAALAKANISWNDYDVVILGRLSPLGEDAALKELAGAVTRRGVGLLLMGGRRLFNDSDARHSPLATVSPVAFVRDQFGLRGPLQFVPTRVGLQHAVLRGAIQPVSSDTQRLSSDDEATRWKTLPRLGTAALLGEPNPLATVLARDAGGRTLLAAQEVGSGRCLAAGLESTWPWALASDDGAALHRRFWAQMVLWLANRRPRAWVLTDQPSYALAALRSGQAQIRIRAGISQSDLADDGVDFRSATARLELVDGDQRHPVPLKQHAGEWRAELSGLDAAGLPAGQHRLEFTIGDAPAVDAPADPPGAAPAPTTAASQPDVLTARTEFALLEKQIEFEPPTANLPLLRSAAEATASAGGQYCPLQDFPQMLDKLSRTDRRQEVRRPMRYALLEQHAWPALLTAAAVLGLEWLIRKRLGLP